MPAYQIGFVDANGNAIIDGVTVSAYSTDGLNTLIQSSVTGASPANTGQGACSFTSLLPNVSYKFSFSAIITGFITAKLPTATEIVIPTSQVGPQGIQGNPGIPGLGFTFRASWNSLNSYAVNDVVLYNGSAYVATAANQNSNPGSSGNWSVIASQGQQGIQGIQGNPGNPGTNGTSFTYMGTWSSATTYALNQVVSYNNSSYISILASNTNHNPASSPTYWSYVAVGGHGSTLSTAGVSSTGVNSSLTVNVIDGTAFPTLSYLVISDGTNAIYGKVTAGGTSNALTINVLYPVSAVSIASGATVTFGGPLVNSFNYYDISGQYNGSVNVASQTMQTIIAPRSFTLSAGTQLNQIYAGTAPTLSATFLIQRNGTQIGTMVLNSNATKGNVIIASTTVFNQGDVFSVVTPSVADSSLANVAYTVSGVVN
jgi:hypothetical protein